MRRLRKFITLSALRLLRQLRKYLTLAMRRLFSPGPVALAAFAAVTVGLWWERPSLALIIPGAMVFGCLTWTHLRGRSNA